jgi:hypothetical protein
MKIEGIVAPHGGGAGGSGDGRRWWMTFTLDPWSSTSNDCRRRRQLA